MSTGQLKLQYHKGMIVLLIAVGIGFAAINTGSNIQWFIFSIILSVVLISKIAGVINLIGVSAKIKEVPEVFANRKSYVPIVICNKRSIGIANSIWLGLRVAGQDGFEKVFLDRIKKEEEKVLLYEVNFAMRGETEIKEVEILSGFPIDLLRSSRHIKVNQKILVYPEIISLAPLKRRIKMFSEGNGSLMKGEKSSEILNIYRCSGNEAYRNIHWKITAKKDELWAKEFSKEESKKLIVMMDWQNISSNLRERAISMAASLTLALYNNLLTWRLISGDFDTGFGMGRAHLKKCLEYLALIKEYSIASFYNENGSIIKISDLLKGV